MLVNLTKAALNQVDTLCKEHNVFAISLNVKGGGCAGFEYDWGTINDPSNIEDGDEIIATPEGNNFVVGSHSIMFLLGSEIDYVKSLTATQFEISNPLAHSSCGCGISVNFNIDKIPDLK
jgi:iron-sulfur cluster assembly accessory protein